MANQYYGRTFAFAERTKARGEEVREEFDSLVSGMDGVENDTNRSIKMPDGMSIELPSIVADRSLMVIGFDVAGNVELQAGVGAWKGDWVTATDYKIRDIMVDSAGVFGQDNIYISNAVHTSSALLSSDAAHWDLMIDISDVKASETAAAASAAAALVSEGLADADRVQTNADALATAADLVQTNLDQISCDADAVQVAADLVATNQDTIDTAADLVQTNLDQISCASDAVDTAADLVQTNLDQIQTTSDTVDTAADLVQTNLDQISCDADAIQVAADLVATNQDTIDTAADLVATNQDTLDTAADLLATNADVVSTNSDAVDTAADLVLTNAKYDEFDDRYLGVYASDPTLDNDLNPLIEGTMYWSSVAKIFKGYDGTAWINLPATTAAGTTFAATGNISATDVQAGMAELDSEKEPSLVVASQVEMETGTEVDLRSMSPLRIAQAIASIVPDPFASGTVMLFRQTAAPTGWTKVTADVDDKALRVVSGTLADSGTVAFQTAFSSKSVSGSIANRSLSVANLAAHSHPITNGTEAKAGSARIGRFAKATAAGNLNTNNSGSNTGHNHTFTGTAINLDVSHIDVIIATKD